MSRQHALLTLALFAVGIVAGVVGERLTSGGPPSSPYAELPTAGEPAAAAQVAEAIRRDDPRALADLIQDQQLLQDLQTGLQPIVLVSEVKFVGAADNNGRTLSAYVAKGRDSQGNKAIVGFVLQVQHDEVVGIN